MSLDWRYGYPFVGNQLAVDFVNTRPVVDGVEKELLPHAAALAHWLKAAALIDEQDFTRLSREWLSDRYLTEMEHLHGFRERLRRVLFLLESQRHAPESFITEINRMLLAHPRTEQVAAGPHGLVRTRIFKPKSPLDLFGPLSDATVDLLTVPSRSRIRKCPNCVLHFLDTGKSGSRIWCSMKLCGNRVKVAAFAKRQRSS